MLSVRGMFQHPSKEKETSLYLVYLIRKHNWQASSNPGEKFYTWKNCSDPFTGDTKGCQIWIRPKAGKNSATVPAVATYTTRPTIRPNIRPYGIRSICDIKKYFDISRGESQCRSLGVWRKTIHTGGLHTVWKTASYMQKGLMEAEPLTTRDTTWPWGWSCLPWAGFWQLHRVSVSILSF